MAQFESVNQSHAATVSCVPRLRSSVPNKTDAPNPALALRFQIEHPWHRAGDLEGSGEESDCPEYIHPYILIL